MFSFRTETSPSKFFVMEIWLKLSILLCVFGFVKEFRPSEPFIIPYLAGEWKNFTDQVIFR
jgi:thiamine transporter 2/3